MTDDPIITINDVRKTGHCVAGIRTWFGLNGLDFRGFVKDGVPASVLLATGDPLASEVVAKAAEGRRDG